MIKDTLQKIESIIANSTRLPKEKKDTLLELFSQLKTELSGLPDSDKANSVAGFTQLSTQEALRETPDPTLLDKALEGLDLAAQELKVSHPRLVSLLVLFARTLSRLGI